jgi:putative peptidoglycan lipid II flippase
MLKTPQAATDATPASTAGELERTPTTNRKIFEAAATVALCASLALLVSIGKELVVAHFFGRGDVLDAFLIAYLLPSFLIYLVAGSFSSAVIPTFIQVREAEGLEAAQRLFSSMLGWSLGLLVAVSAILAVLAPYYLPLLGSAFNPAKLILTRRLLWVLLPLITLSGCVVIWTAVLNAEERFALPALSPILTPLSAILFLVLAGKTLGIYALALGTVTGVALQTTILARAFRGHGLRLKLRWDRFDPNLRQVAHQYIPMMAGAFLMGSTDLVDQSMAAMLEPGSVAALSYAKKIVSVFVTIGVVPLSNAALPYFSQMVAAKDWAGCRHTLKTYSRLILLFTVPAALGLILFSQPVVRILFQRGAFTARDAKVVAHVQQFLALQIPFFMLGNLGVRLISALKRNSLLMRISAVNLVLNIVLNWIFMRYAGVAGIALSTSTVYFVSCVLVYVSLFGALRPLELRKFSDGSRSL